MKALRIRVKSPNYFFARVTSPTNLKRIYRKKFHNISLNCIKNIVYFTSKKNRLYIISFSGAYSVSNFLWSQTTIKRWTSVPYFTIVATMTEGSGSFLNQDGLTIFTRNWLADNAKWVREEVMIIIIITWKKLQHLILKCIGRWLLIMSISCLYP